MNALDDTHLKNHFLIAMPTLADTYFGHSITYICEHNEKGAMGIVVNRPTALTLADMFEHLNINLYDTQHSHNHILSGGPVQAERGFVLHRTPHAWEATVKLSDGICMTTSRDILDAIAHNQGPEESLIALGYAGWGSGQLEQEMAQNTWLSVEADPDIVFSTPCDQRWQAAAQLLGIDLSLISRDIGHA